MTEFFKNAFKDMMESAKAQHEIDKANFAAARAESRAQFAEVKAASRPETRKAALQEERQQQLAEAEARKVAAEARIQAVQK